MILKPSAITIAPQENNVTDVDWHVTVDYDTLPSLEFDIQGYGRETPVEVLATKFYLQVAQYGIAVADTVVRLKRFPKGSDLDWWEFQLTADGLVVVQLT